MTANNDLFRQSIRHIPAIDPHNWRLIVDGYVTQPLTLDYDKLQAMPSTTTSLAWACIGHTPEHPMLAEATWTGIPLTDILRQIAPEPTACYANFNSVDGYTTSLPLDRLQGSLLAHTLDGNALPAEHGFPVRLVVPGLAGYKMPKWITHITLTDQIKQGFWERRGVAQSGTISPVITIDDVSPAITYGEHVTLSGKAYAGNHVVSSVHISVDQNAPAAIPHTGGDVNRLAYWQTSWQPPAPGRYNVEVQVRAANGETATHHVIVEVTI